MIMIMYLPEEIESEPQTDFYVQFSKIFPISQKFLYIRTNFVTHMRVFVFWQDLIFLLSKNNSDILIFALLRAIWQLPMKEEYKKYKIKFQIIFEKFHKIFIKKYFYPKKSNNYYKKFAFLKK